MKLDSYKDAGLLVSAGLVNEFAPSAQREPPASRRAKPLTPLPPSRDRSAIG